MDELVIGEKKYISSKRAAEITGYAKDYIGQLCREGRVEARLVGRSWYVLEDSVLEHRFGTGEKEAPITPITEVPLPEEETVSSWKSPTYTSEQMAPLPELKIERPSLPSHINLLSKLPSPATPLPEAQEEKEVIQEAPYVEEIAAPVAPIEEEQSGETVIPVHKIIPAPVYEEGEQRESNQPSVPVRRVHQRKRRGSLVSSAIVVAIAVLALALIVVGTGITEGNALLGGKNSPLIDFLGGKSFYSR